MVLDGGALGGARILAAKSVAAIGQDHIGAVGVWALTSAMAERSEDFAFVAGGSAS